MANQFYVGQRVMSNKFDKIGTVDDISCDATDPYPMLVSMGDFKRTYSLDGRHLSGEPIDLFPIDQPRTVLTDWQRKQLKDIGYTDNFIAKIESILSKPEPPKYVPKEGEAVLYESNIWMAGVFTNMVKGKFRIASGNSTFCVDRVIPFDSSLHGSNVND